MRNGTLTGSVPKIQSDGVSPENPVFVPRCRCQIARLIEPDRVRNPFFPHPGWLGYERPWALGGNADGVRTSYSTIRVSDFGMTGVSSSYGISFQHSFPTLGDGTPVSFNRWHDLLRGVIARRQPPDRGGLRGPLSDHCALKGRLETT